MPATKPASKAPAKTAGKSVAKPASKTSAKVAPAKRTAPKAPVARKQAATRKSTSTARSFTPRSSTVKQGATSATEVAVPAQATAPAVEVVTARPAPVAAQPVQPVVYAPVPPTLPQVPVIKSKSYAAPLSFVGSARRIGGFVNRLANGNSGVNVVLWIFLGAPAIAAAWMFVAGWYVVIFGLFGVFTFPFRLMRRSQRKSQHIQQVSLATQQALLAQQQQQQIYAQQHARR